MSINVLVLIRSSTIILWLGVLITSIFTKYDTSSSKYIPDILLMLIGLCFFAFSMLMLILELIKANNHKGWLIFIIITDMIIFFVSLIIGGFYAYEAYMISVSDNNSQNSPYSHGIISFFGFALHISYVFDVVLIAKKLSIPMNQSGNELKTFSSASLSFAVNNLNEIIE